MGISQPRRAEKRRCHVIDPFACYAPQRPVSFCSSKAPSCRRNSLSCLHTMHPELSYEELSEMLKKNTTLESFDLRNNKIDVECLEVARRDVWTESADIVADACCSTDLGFVVFRLCSLFLFWVWNYNASLELHLLCPWLRLQEQHPQSHHDLL